MGSLFSSFHGRELLLQALCEVSACSHPRVCAPPGAAVQNLGPGRLPSHGGLAGLCAPLPSAGPSILAALLLRGFSDLSHAVTQLVFLSDFGGLRT